MKVVIEVGGHGGHCKLPPVSGAELIKEEIDESESFVLESESSIDQLGKNDVGDN